MGSGHSRRRRRDMATQQSPPDEAATSADPDISAILSYLIRSGQVHILNPSGMLFDDDDDDEMDDDEEDDIVRPSQAPRVDPCPDTTALDISELKQEILLSTGAIQPSSTGSPVKQTSLCKLLHMREVGSRHRHQNFSQADYCTVSSNYLPNSLTVKARYHHKAFCGTFSQDGNIFLTACQDKIIRVYDTSQGQFKMFKAIHARDVGWSVLDTAFSPDGNYLIYSSWSECVHLCNIHGEHDTHEALHLFPDTDHSFCIFSLCFSHDNREILGGANDGCLYIYDREKNERILKIDSHEDDVNAVAFADASSHILFSGGDDGLCKVWDRRTLDEEYPIPVGILAGHADGIIFIDSKDDTRYLISNSKDQSIKLWDMRRFSAKEAISATKKAVEKQKWDYRWQQVPSKVMRMSKKITGDTSLMTYRGHCVLNTLVRCRFSPIHYTGQRYIYSGCATGAVVVYDVLTGKIETKLTGHRACVRDISWHPYENKLLSTSWDSTIGEWTYREKWTADTDDASSDSDSSDDDNRRQSDRLKHRGRTSGRLGGLFSGFF